MLLSGQILDNVAGVNDFEVVPEARFTEADPVFIYIRLCDLNKDKNSRPAGRRYIPATGATLQITIKSVDTAKTLVKTATNPYSGDTSIWRIQLTAADALKGTYSMQLALTEGASVTRGLLSNVIVAQPQSWAKI